ncbi:putative ribonuclease H-like domain-containing protein [Tanacetum coccineum]|uniref:Ribonuclease H-like domain-containing protein n=1 Tax=Tanacetum coccineum TaxID=301880 RepID=A0ABQ5DPV7_9ASTR
MDDLYNNLKIYEPEVKGTSSSSTNTQNVAFVSANSSTNRAVNTTHGATTSSTQATYVNSTTIDNLSDDVICAFFVADGYANNEDKDILEEHWKEVFCGCAGLQGTKKIGIGRTQEGMVRGEQYKLPNAFRCLVMVLVMVEVIKQKKVQLTLHSWLTLLQVLTLSLESVEARLLVYKKNKSIYEEDIKPIVIKHVAENSEAKASEAKPKAVRKNNGALIIEDWVSDNEEDDVPSGGNPQMDLQDQGVIDSGCSRRMTGNMSYLTDYEEIDGGYVAFGGNPKGGKITGKCTIKTATFDESKLCHRRLEHINFKTMNKLVKGNLVRGLPSKLFENDQTYVACQKGKQHRASCKSKTVNSISQPLHMLHMDLIGLTFVKSLMTKMYCLVVTDSWVFFLATKDETSGILKSFIIRVENLIDQRVKVIRCDNGTEFKNKEMNQFCERKGIKREFNVARTPQQNRVAERKNGTLIKAARTMLADSKLPTTFWAEAVNTACYVQNRVLVTKPHNKTPYELFLGRKPALGFMRPFGCPVIILNTIDHLGKFDGKVDEGFFVGYSINSKAFRVFNRRTRIVEENLHVQFSENTPNIAGSTKACDDAGKARMDTIPGKDYILLPLWTADLPFSQSSKSSPDTGFKPSGDDEKKKEDNVNSTNNVNAASTNEVNVVDAKTSMELPLDLNMLELEDYSIFEDDEDVGAEADMNNLDTTIQVSPIPTTRIHKDHPLDQVIRDLKSAPQTRRMSKNLEAHEFVSTIQQRTNHKDLQNCLFACFLSQEEPKKVIHALKDPSWIEAMQEELLQFKLKEV